MPRRSNKASQTQTPAASAAAAVGVKKVRRTEEFLEEIKPGAEQTRQQVVIHGAPVQPQTQEEDYLDSLEELLDDMEAEEIIYMNIERLPDFKKTGKYGRGSTTEFCGRLPFSPTWKEDVQAFGAGDYRIRLLDSSLHYLKGRRNLFTLSVAAPIKTPIERTVNGQPVMPIQTEAPPQKSFIEQLEEYAKITKSLALIANPTGAHAVAPQPEKIVERPLEEKVTEKIIDHVFSGSDVSLQERALSKWLGEDKEDFSWSAIFGSFAKEIIVPLAPMIPQLLSAILTRQAPGAPVANQQALSGEVAPPIQPPTQAPPPAMLTNFQKIMGQTRQGCLLGLPPESIAIVFDALTDETNHAQLQAIFSQAPEGIATALQLPQTHENLAWIGLLKVELDRDDSQTEEEED